VSGEARANGRSWWSRAAGSAAKVPLPGLIVWGVVAPVAIVSLVVRTARRRRRAAS